MSRLRLVTLAGLLWAMPAFAQDNEGADPAGETESDPATEATPDVSPETSDPPAADVSPETSDPAAADVSPETSAPPGPETAADVSAETSIDPSLGFAFGSYGRIGVGSDLRGGSPERIAVVAHPPRIVEPSYVETDLYYRFLGKHGVRVRTVTTLALADTLFHYTGEFDARPALRNLFLEAKHPSGFEVWVGSRMYRGDDIYLFDYWPLDDLNTLGAGVALVKKRFDVRLHAGANRLLDPFQVQTREVSDPDFGAATVEVLDRQRLIASLIATGYLDVGAVHGKAKLFLEVQHLAAGDRRRADDSLEHLAADQGFSAGIQLGAWGFAQGHSNLNLFARYAKGLSAFDELAPPSGFDKDFSTWPGAHEFVLGAGSAIELSRLAIHGAAYARRFEDNDAASRDRDDAWEYAVDVRPEAALAYDVKAGLDVSYQARFPEGVSPNTLLAADPAVFQLAPMLIYAPMGSGAYDRPQFRLVYRAAHLNDAARDLYALDDPRRDDAWVHYLGFQAEWWFNSSTR